MGRGTIHRKDWKETTLQVVIDARRLYCHSVKIMGNEKVFKPENDFHNRTLIVIADKLLSIYQRVWEANSLNVIKRPELADERLELQRFAAADCRYLLSLFELVKSQFHLPAAKFWNWMDMLVTLGKKIAAWNKSDERRFGDLRNQDGGRLLGHGVVEVGE